MKLAVRMDELVTFDSKNVALCRIVSHGGIIQSGAGRFLPRMSGTELKNPRGARGGSSEDCGGVRLFCRGGDLQHHRAVAAYVVGEGAVLGAQVFLPPEVADGL